MAIACFSVVKHFRIQLPVPHTETVPHITYITDDFVLTCDTGNLTEVKFIVSQLVKAQCCIYPPESIYKVVVYMLEENEPLTIDSRSLVFHPTVPQLAERKINLLSVANYIELWGKTREWYSYAESECGIYTPMKVANTIPSVNGEELFLQTTVVWNKKLGLQLRHHFRGKRTPTIARTRRGALMMTKAWQDTFKEWEQEMRPLYGFFSDYYLDRHNVCRLGYRIKPGAIVHIISDLELERRREASITARQVGILNRTRKLTEMLHHFLEVMENNSYAYNCNAGAEVPQNRALPKILAVARLMKVHLVASYFSPAFASVATNDDLLAVRDYESKSAPGYYERYSAFPVGTFDRGDIRYVYDWPKDEVRNRWDGLYTGTETPTNKADVLECIDRLDMFIGDLAGYQSGEDGFNKIPLYRQTNELGEVTWAPDFDTYDYYLPSDEQKANREWYEVRVTGEIDEKWTDPSLNRTANFFTDFANFRQDHIARKGVLREATFERRKLLIPFAIREYHVTMKECLKLDSLFAWIERRCGCKSGSSYAKNVHRPYDPPPANGGGAKFLSFAENLGDFLVAIPSPFSSAYAGRVHPSAPPSSGKDYPVMRPFDYDRRDVYFDVSDLPDLPDDPPEDEEDEQEPDCDDGVEEPNSPQTLSKIWDFNSYDTEMSDAERRREAIELLDTMEENGKLAAHLAYDGIAFATAKMALGQAMEARSGEAHLTIDLVFGEINPCDNAEEFPQDVVN